ncbi:MAG: sulfotransferase [Rhizomicrobium sp.]
MSDTPKPVRPNIPAPGAKEPAREWMSVPDAIAKATQLYTAGRLRKAEILTRDILIARPQNAEALNILGVILHGQGKVDEGIAKVREAAACGASNPNIFANLGEMERKAKNLEAAEAALNRAIALDPESAQAHNNLGIVFYDKREFQKAADSYRAAIALVEDYPEAHNNLGNALRALDDIHEAMKEYERAIELREDYAEAYNNMGTALRDLQKFEEAEYSYRRAATIRPSYLEALNNLANLLVFLKRYDDALRVLGDTLKIFPKDVGTLVTTAHAQMALGNNTLAKRAAELAMVEDPKNVSALCLHGQICHETDQFDEALKAYEAALEIDPNSVEALNLYGVALKSVGRLEDARSAFMKALELHPRAIGAYSNIVDLENFTKDHPLFRAMSDLLANAKEPEQERFMALHFALGKANDDAGEYEAALKHFSTGARLKRSQLDYDEREAFAFFDDIRKTFDEEYFANLPFEGNPTRLPIFIVGMPRSGSTLTEQIIASHPQVYGAGEIKNLSSSLGAVRARFPNVAKFPDMAKSMKPSQFAMIADNYLKSISQFSATATRVTDKLLTNYYFVGMIATLFPNAKIIHTMRNPVDTCLSSFTKLYKDDMPHSYDLAELGRYYSKYRELMAHWRRVLPPGIMLETQYEQVVADEETAARQIIEFLDLPWDDRCVNFHETNRPVKTASVSQVRRPIYSSSVERWRRYGAGLQPLIDALDAGVPE